MEPQELLSLKLENYLYELHQWQHNKKGTFSGGFAKEIQSTEIYRSRWCVIYLC